MSVFDQAARTIFADTNIASGASFRAGGSGVSVPVRAIIRAPDQFANFGEGRFLSDTVLVDVQTQTFRCFRPETRSRSGWWSTRSAPILSGIRND